MGMFMCIPPLVCVQSTYGSSTLGYMECYIEYSRLQGWGSSQSKAQGPTWHSGQDPKCPKVFEESNKHETPSWLICLLQWVLSVSSRRHSLEWPMFHAFMKPQTSRESEEVVKIFEAQRTPPKVKR
ncbi:hypothetical protein EDD16DRAFT_1521016 [Pisolithus croceorrhizus]|nr:hypothetical protein EDD16DRAFT_1521016 [Pisolithus croceorrhizus]